MFPYKGGQGLFFLPSQEGDRSRGTFSQFLLLGYVVLIFESLPHLGGSPTENRDK